MSKRKAQGTLKKRGAKPYEPTDAQRGEVRGMAMANIPQDVMAGAIGIDVKTLRLRFPHEVEFGRTKLMAAAAMALAKMVYGNVAEYDRAGKIIRAEVKPELGACCFILKTQGKTLGWSERLEHTGANGIPLFNDLDLRKLDDEEFKTLSVLLRKCGVEITA